MDGSSAVWFGAPNFEVLHVADDGVELTISIESTVTVTGCASCGTRARAKDRRWVRLRDAPSADRAVRVEWRKRVWSCPEPDCEVKTWTEQSMFADARRVLTVRAGERATDRIAAIEGTPASIARGFGVSWPTVWSTVERIARARVEDPERLGATAMVGFDETVTERWRACGIGTRASELEFSVGRFACSFVGYFRAIDSAECSSGLLVSQECELAVSRFWGGRREAVDSYHS